MRMRQNLRIMLRISRALSVLGFVACMPTAFAQDGPLPPWIKDPGIKVYREKYLTGNAHKAFSVAESGQFGWSVKRESAGRASQLALFNCIQQATTGRCYLFSVDGNVVIDLYQIAVSDTAAVLSRMRPPRQQTTADETKDTGLAPTYDPRVSKLRAPTPPTSPYALTLTTGALAEALADKNPPTLLDVSEPGKEYKRNVIPGAIWLGGAGLYDEKTHAQTDRYLAHFMGQITSNKEKPIVVYCTDWQCWEAYNAMQRLYILGYRKLYWYRGGMASWTKAGLPVVQVPLAAQVALLK